MIRDLLPVPAVLTAEFRVWTSQGQPGQDAVVWNPDRWRRTLPAYAALFDRLPANGLDRAAVADAFADATMTSPSVVLDAFLTSYAWGQGRNAYGPARAARILTANPDAAPVLAEVAQLARTAGGPAAFGYLAANRLRGLGPAFATKFLHFAGAAADADLPPLIMDKLTAGFLAAHTGWKVNSQSWSRTEYRRYLTTAAAKADLLGTTPTIVEYLMFRTETAKRPGNQWAP